MSLCKWLPLRIQLGNKVGISKRRQNDNEEGELKRYDDGDKELKQAHKMLRKVRQKEMRTIKKLIPEKNDSSTRVSSKLSSLQTLSTVISLLKDEAGRFADRWFRPEYHSLFFAKATLRCIVETFLRRLSKHADIRAQLKTGEACNRCTISIPSSQLSQY